MNAATTVPRPNTRDMLAIHQIFRDAFGCSAQLVGSVCNDQSDSVETVAAYYANVLAMLRAHHEGEDELVWPKLIERAPDQGELVARMADAHEGLAVALVEAESRLAAWIASPDIDHGATLAAALASLGVLCAAHFDEEERRVLPLAEEYCTVEEWGELPGHAMRTFSGDRLWLVIGLVREQMPAEAQAMHLEKMPPPVRDMWLNGGRERFEQFVAELRG
jgi:hemerythrin-like domain-containing protein